MKPSNPRARTAFMLPVAVMNRTDDGPEAERLADAAAGA